MAQHWVCPAGHGGSDRLSMPTCPVCGLPITYSAVSAVDETRFEGPKQHPLAGSSGGSVTDLLFVQQPGASAVPPRPDDVALDQTLDHRPSGSPYNPPPMSGNTWPLSPLSFSEPPNLDDTMQRSL